MLQGAGGELEPSAEPWQRTLLRCASSQARMGGSACRTSLRCGKSACANSASLTCTGMQTNVSGNDEC